MNTPSHLLMAAAIDKALPRVPIVKTAFLLGSVAPDVPLWILSIGGIVYYRFLLGWDSADVAHLLFDDLYFHHPLWLIGHNVLHSPVLLLVGLSVVWRSRRNIGSRSCGWFWFLVACLLHSAVDILTHADDGPLLLFPLNWNLRFHSPVSYWDSNHYGRQFQVFELALDGVLLIYLLKQRVCRFFRKVNRFHCDR
ncbi:metal-dependent hydrolase [Microcoleus sp. FACHB-1515]|uniref:metal-dependent hydrolase n=1 Tax=Cyanophyceae TaxID=3028117 RepID=UPI0016838DE5|nr:metal-dependent hydrolase [Microcoleus sp. FACHB-1515]MBD2092389.1 metal-dependent hydrolase [Microcoleus sp. FACHB-1515]